MLPYRKGFSQVQIELEFASSFVLGDLAKSHKLPELDSSCDSTHPIYWVGTELLWEDAKPSKNAVAIRGEMDGGTRFLGQL
jgi:hypothetical protein